MKGKKTNFHDDKVPKEGSQYICLSIILNDFVFKTGNNYYPQMLEEFYLEHIYLLKK